MSPEALFLLALFILLPLIERLLRSARHPDGGAPDRAADVPRPVSPPSIPPPAPRRQPPEDARVPRTADVPPVLAGPAARQLPRRPPTAPGARRTIRRGLVVEDLRNPLTVRRAIVLMTILGPCRSAVPHDWAERRGLR